MALAPPARETYQRGYAESGWRGGLRAFVEAAATQGGGSPVITAWVFATLGEVSLAFEWLERAYEERDLLMVLLPNAPVFDPLHSDPRFQDLLRRIGFPDR